MLAAVDLDFSGFVYDRTTVTEYAFNWKTFIEVYLEDYHVVPYHPGLGPFVDCEQLKWEYGANWSVQTAVEDDDICYGMHHGRRALYRQGINETGPYQSPTEDGMVHFHEWYRRALSASL